MSIYGIKKLIKNKKGNQRSKIYKIGKTGEDVQKLQELKEAVLLNPQRLNRYAYVGNNPVNRRDPTGLDWEYDTGTGTLNQIDSNGNQINSWPAVSGPWGLG